jgi:hypothetical protein
MELVDRPFGYDSRIVGAMVLLNCLDGLNLAANDATPVQSVIKAMKKVANFPFQKAAN